MNHKQFEEWLLNDQPLTSEQHRGLILHVRECRTCAALEKSNFALRAAPAVSASAGFSSRFQVRLARQRVTERRKILFNTTLLSLAAVSILVLWLYPYIPFLLHVSPEQIISAWTNSLVPLSATSRALGIIAGTIFNMTFTFAPGYIESFILTLLVSLTAVWIGSIQKIRTSSSMVQGK